jgi:2-deoxy-D-gluconate 3-dehydrogenase
MGECDSAAQEVEALGRRALALPLDVRDRESAAAAVDAIVKAWGGLDIWVNNAGIIIRKPALELAEEDWDAVVDVDLKGVFLGAQAAARAMVERGGGKIINIASINGMIGSRTRAAYCASKAGAINLTRTLALEWATHKINVNAVAPTYIDTPLTQRLFEDKEFLQEVLGRTPMRRLGRPEEVAAAVVFLASPASDMITGHTLVVDGGWTAS